MVYIVAGGIDEGKTQHMIDLYHKKEQGDGFISRKIFVDGNGFIGYELVRLGTGEKLPLAYKSEHVPGDWDEIYRFGPFSFSKKAFAFAERIIAEIIDKGIEPVFIDEIGPLELRGQGFCNVLKNVLKTQRDVFLAVRNHCVKEVIEKFAIQNYNVITVSSTLPLPFLLSPVNGR
jgi:nucleoside-triphosphatase THEP1